MIDFASLSEREMLEIAVNGSAYERFMLAGVELLPLAVDLVLIVEPDEGCGRAAS